MHHVVYMHMQFYPYSNFDLLQWNLSIKDLRIKDTSLYSGHCLLSQLHREVY